MSEGRFYIWFGETCLTYTVFVKKGSMLVVQEEKMIYDLYDSNDIHVFKVKKKLSCLCGNEFYTSIRINWKLNARLIKYTARNG